MAKKIKVSGGMRTNAEEEEGRLNEACFEKNPLPWEKRMENFPKYVRRQSMTRFLALYELFKTVLEVKGSIVECGVYQGFGLMSWVKFSAILEPVNLTRRIYGFDSFEGFPKISKRDRSEWSDHLEEGDLFSDSQVELEELISIHDSTRFLGHIPKVELIKGDATATIPRFVETHPHVIVSLLFLDFDLYEPTNAALEHFLPRMPAGAVVAFDELDNPLWPGETQAAIELLQEKRLKIQRLSFDPYIGFAVLD